MNMPRIRHILFHTPQIVPGYPFRVSRLSRCLWIFMHLYIFFCSPFMIKVLQDCPLPKILLTPGWVTTGWGTLRPHQHLMVDRVWAMAQHPKTWSWDHHPHSNIGLDSFEAPQTFSKSGGRGECSFHWIQPIGAALLFLSHCAFAPWFSRYMQTKVSKIGEIPSFSLFLSASS